MNAAAIQNTGIQWEPGKWLGAGKKDEGRPSSRKRGKASASPVAVLPGTPEKTPDEKLMVAISTGDKLALEELYDRYFSGCYGLALKIVSDPAAAEEIVQDVFLKLWSRPESYVPERGK